ncbi:MAG: hypothetical protein R2867_06190 [Caldilineaceae bacterium]
MTDTQGKADEVQRSTLVPAVGNRDAFEDAQVAIHHVGATSHGHRTLQQDTFFRP